MTNSTEKKQPTNELALLKKNITDQVLARITPMMEAKEIRLPANYSVGNALTSAWFDLEAMKMRDGKPVLEACTKASIANSLFKMCVWGLSSAKKQVAFIPYDDKLTCQPEYHGNIALAKRYGGVADVIANVVYKGDIFEYTFDTTSGKKKIVKHEQVLENINDENIRGAYAVVLFEDDRDPFIEVMTMEQIKRAWMQGATKGASPAHKNFGGEMSKKTVINRALKLYISSSDDAVLFDEDETNDLPKQTRDEHIEEKGNKKTINADDVQFEEVAAGPPDEPAQSLSSLGESPGY